MERKSGKVFARASKHADKRDGQCECTCDECESGNCDECDNPECDDPNCEDCPMQAQDDRSKKRLELRTLASAELRATETKAAGKMISGWAAVFGSQADLGAFTETIRPGAFTRTLKEGCDCRLLNNHDPNQLLARTKSGTLRLQQDDIGLKFVASLPDTRVATDAFALVQRGDLSGCSFGFELFPNGDSWPSDNQRELLSVKLFDCSLATFPAYPDTSVSARSAARSIASTGVYHSIVEEEDLELERLRMRIRLARL